MQINIALTSMEGFSAYHVQLQYFNNQTTCTKLQIIHTRWITTVYSLLQAVFSRPSMLKGHESTHTERAHPSVYYELCWLAVSKKHIQNLFSCTDFEVRFVQPVNLTGEKPFSCPYCEEFSLSDSLKTHLHTHPYWGENLLLHLLWLHSSSHLLYAHSPDWPSPGMKLPCHSPHQHVD